MELRQVLDALEAIAPRRLASDWDNVGLLVQGTRPIRRLFLTIDLSTAVLDEATADEADLIISYHPPIFRGLKRLTHGRPDHEVILRSIRQGLHIYSPHTALDAAAGGMAEWLIGGLGALHEIAPLEADPVDPNLGAGRRGTLRQPTSVDELVARIKAHLGLDALRVAAVDTPPPVRTLAVCPGAGGSVLGRASDADLWLTGELRHHDVLSRLASGGCTVLTDHTNTERGYLPRYAETLRRALDLPVRVSETDADPLRIV